MTADSVGTRGTSTVAIVGGSLAGSAAALAMAEYGHRVLLLERAARPDDGPVLEVGSRWRRPTVPQAEHSHTLTSAGVGVLRTRAAALWRDLLAAGAVPLDLLAALPPHASHRDREPGDDALVALACRRMTLDLVLYRRVRALPGVTVRHGATVRGITVDGARRRVTGVILDDGSHLPADIVLDATGRRGAARTWLADAGIPLDHADLIAPTGFRGFTRFYRLKGPNWPGPLNRGNAVGVIADHYVAVVHPGDNYTFSVVLAVLPEDTELRHLRHEPAFTAVARAVAPIAPWLAEDIAEPISPVRAITCPPNALRAAAVAERPPLAGLYPVGDAACVTNPMYGRGMSLAFVHAYALADLIAERPDVDREQSSAAAQLADRLLRPWYVDTAWSDAERIAQWQRIVRAAPRPAAGGEADTGLSLAEIAAAAQTDGLVWRGLIRYLMTLTPRRDIVGDAAFRDRVGRCRIPDPPGPGVPDRDSMIRLVHDALGATSGRWK
ncbi:MULTISPECIES: NAD(P)/FAD-dependent oxidoreductase [unclassified Nocardia]|uniref:FAD-dependent oxidoreductase n=1 Tax=unclassified Nocardia TaxID=2637762 RepID=UPI001CE478A4|nr:MULTISPECIES: FAD-dependent monooxygenase [unclassified Nocardia]